MDSNAEGNMETTHIKDATDWIDAWSDEKDAKGNFVCHFCPTYKFKPTKKPRLVHHLQTGHQKLAVRVRGM